MAYWEHFCTSKLLRINKPNYITAHCTVHQRPTVLRVAHLLDRRYKKVIWCIKSSVTAEEAWRRMGISGTSINLWLRWEPNLELHNEERSTFFLSERIHNSLKPNLMQCSWSHVASSESTYCSALTLMLILCFLLPAEGGFINVPHHHWRHLAQCQRGEGG